MNATAPATAKQAAFAARLAAERNPARFTPAITMGLAALKADTANAALASATIEGLLAIPKDPSREAPKAAPGYYLHQGSCYVVVVGKENPDRTYAKRLSMPAPGSTKGSWVYAPGMLQTLATAPKMTLEQAKEFGKLHGVCCICGKTLSDPKSVEAGIGPVCIKKVG